MRYYSEETVKKIMQEVEVKEIQCNVYDNLYSVQRIYPNLDNFESIDIAEPHGRLIDADKLLPESGYEPMMFKPKYGGDHRTQYNTLMGYEILGIVEDAPTILEASK